MYRKDLQKLTFLFLITFTLPILPLSLIEVHADHHHDLPIEERRAERDKRRADRDERRADREGREARKKAEDAAERSQEATEEAIEATTEVAPIIGPGVNAIKKWNDAANAMQEAIDARNAATEESCNGGCGATFLGKGNQEHKVYCYRYPHNVNGAWWYSCQRDSCPLWHTVPPGYTPSSSSSSCTLCYGTGCSACGAP